MRFHVLLVVAAFGLAGCASPTDKPEAEAPTTPTPASNPHVDLYTFSFHSVVGAADMEFPSNSNTLSFATQRNATGLLVELAWNHTIWSLDAFLRSETWQCDDGGSNPLADLGEQIFCPLNDAVGLPRDGEFRGYGGTMGEPKSPAIILIESSELQTLAQKCQDDCDWMAWAEAPEPRADFDWHLFVSVFYGEIPADYTAIPWLQ